MTAGGISRGRTVSRVYRSLIAVVMAGLLFCVAWLAASAADAGSAGHVSSQVRPPRPPASRVAPAKVKALRTAIWRTVGHSRAASSVQSVCNPTGTAAGNCDGFSVAISGDTAVVAAPGINHKAGTAVVFRFVHLRIGGLHPQASWVREATLPDPREIRDDEYAWAVAVSSTSAGTYIAVGGNDNNGKRDYVYVYTGSGKSWHLQAQISDPGFSYEDMFGDALAISATTLVVGASCFDYNSGAAYIYQRSGSRWVLQASMKDPLDREYDSFGEAVAVSGNNVLIGADGEAYLYTQTPKHTWPMTTTLYNPVDPMDNYGNSLAMSGSTIIVGAPGGPPGDLPGQDPLIPGAAYLFTKTGTQWLLTGKLTAPAHASGDEFGFSVAMTATNIIVGMPIYGPKTNCGTAFVYKPSGSTWALQQQLTDPICAAGASFGYAVALSGRAAAVGAPGLNGYQGAAYELLIS